MGGSTATGSSLLSPPKASEVSYAEEQRNDRHYLEHYLNDLLPSRRIEVINAAISSHSSHHHLIYLNQTILKYHPDMVVFIDGYNDYYPVERGYDQFRDYPLSAMVHLYLDEPSFTAWVGCGILALSEEPLCLLGLGKTASALVGAIQSLRPQPRREINVDGRCGNLEL